MVERISLEWSFLLAHMRRERRTVVASRIAWTYCLGCILWGLGGSPLFGIGNADTPVWFLLPVLLYGIPLVALFAGVASVQADACEEDLIRTRDPGRLTRLTGKWTTWTTLLSVASLCMLVPLLPSAGEPGALAKLWAYSAAEIAIFTAAGLALGRLFEDPLPAHSAALVAGMFAIAGGGLVAYVAAWQPVMQRFPDLWTLLLMAHPVEALRVSLVYSVGNLPFDAHQLPPLAAWWLRHPEAWYAILTLGFSSLALGMAAFPARWRRG